MSRFDYVKYDKKAIAQQAAFKEAFEKIEAEVEDDLAPGRARSLILTKLEEAYMWIGKAIRDEQIERNGKASPQEERTDTADWKSQIKNPPMGSVSPGLAR